MDIPSLWQQEGRNAGFLLESLDHSFPVKQKTVDSLTSFLLIPPSAGTHAGEANCIIYQAAGFSGLMSGHKQRTIHCKETRGCWHCFKFLQGPH